MFATAYSECPLEERFWMRPPDTLLRLQTWQAIRSLASIDSNHSFCPSVPSAEKDRNVMSHFTVRMYGVYRHLGISGNRFTLLYLASLGSLAYLPCS